MRGMTPFSSLRNPLGSWIAFCVRWLHVITAMAWIGASFYFIALDLMLKPGKALPDQAQPSQAWLGQAWPHPPNNKNMTSYKRQKLSKKQEPIPPKHLPKTSQTPPKNLPNTSPKPRQHRTLFE